MLNRMRICCHPGCRTMTRSRFCSQHKYEPPSRERDRFLDSIEWRKLSKLKLTETPWCEQCLRDKGIYTPGSDVDHIQSRRQRPDLALNYNNLQTLCLACHAKKTRSGN